MMDLVTLEVREYFSKGEFDILSSSSLGRISRTWFVFPEYLGLLSCEILYKEDSVEYVTHPC